MKIPANIYRHLALGALGVLLIGALIFVVMRAGPLAPTRVTVAKATTGSFVPALFGIGTIEARRSYLIGPTAAGRVLRVAVDVGEPVKAGQLLAEMDPVDFAQRMTALEASKARANEVVAAAEGQRRDVLAKKALAAANTRRFADLAAKNFISPSALEGRLQEQASADAATSVADANLAAARQDLNRLAAERDGVRQQRDSLRLVAPVDGVVISRDAEPGSTVIAGQAVLRLIEPSSLWVRLRLDQGRSAGLAAGLRAQIVLRSQPGQSLPGTVARVEAVSDSVTEERVAQVAFDTLPKGVSVGELAEITLQLDRTAPAILVPNASIKRRGSQTGVWRIDDGKLGFVAVRVGLASLDGQVQVLDGLNAGDQVVAYSEKELAADTRIKIVDTISGTSP